MFSYLPRFVKPGLCLLVFVASMTGTKTYAADDNNDIRDGLLLFGGLLATGLLLNEIADDEPNDVIIRNDTIIRDRSEREYRLSGSRFAERRRRAINACKRKARRDALRAGFDNAWIKDIYSANRAGNGRIKVVGRVVGVYKELEISRRGSDRIVKDRQSRKFRCMFRNGSVRSYKFI